MMAALPPLYTRDILRLAASIPFLDPLGDPHGAAELRSPACGSRMRVAVRLDGAGRVAALGLTVEACAFGQASAALLGRHAVGRSRDEVAAALAELRAWLCGEGAVPAWPGLAVLEPVLGRHGRHGAVMLPFRTLVAAIDAASHAPSVRPE